MYSILNLSKNVVIVYTFHQIFFDDIFRKLFEVICVKWFILFFIVHFFKFFLKSVFLNFKNLEQKKGGVSF